jgi:hypothetical protein
VWNYRVELCKAGTNRRQFDNSIINLLVDFVNNLMKDVIGSSLLKLVLARDIESSPKNLRGAVECTFKGTQA